MFSDLNHLELGDHLINQDIMIIDCNFEPEDVGLVSESLVPNNEVS